jgi:single-stranded DNA-binding protein
MELNENNKITIIGHIASDISFSHECFGERFFSFTIDSARLSGTIDSVPVIASERTLSPEITKGSNVCICGQIRSRNVREEGRNKVKLFIFALRVNPTDEPHMNEAYISGYICKPTTYRKTPEGRFISDLLLAVPRNTNNSDYIPCISWGRDAVYTSDFLVGAQLSFFGRFQSREHDKTINGITERRTVYEVSVCKIEKGTPNE